MAACLNRWEFYFRRMTLSRDPLLFFGCTLFAIGSCGSLLQSRKDHAPGELTFAKANFVNWNLSASNFPRQFSLCRNPKWRFFIRSVTSFVLSVYLLRDSHGIFFARTQIRIKNWLCFYACVSENVCIGCSLNYFFFSRPVILSAFDFPPHNLICNPIKKFVGS